MSSSRRFRWCAAVAAAAALLVFPVSPGRAFASPGDGALSSPDEYQVKARFLFSFAKFVDWPSHKFREPDTPFIIGVIGTDPFGGLLEEAAQDQRINERPVLVRHIGSLEELRVCDILFISRSEAGRLGSILSRVRAENVLTVGDSEKFIASGGIINFVIADNAVHFQINDTAARRANLKISSKLQQLALRTTR